MSEGHGVREKNSSKETLDTTTLAPIDDARPRKTTLKYATGIKKVSGSLNVNHITATRIADKAPDANKQTLNDLKGHFIE